MIKSIKRFFPKLINDFLPNSFFFIILKMFTVTYKPIDAVKNIFITSIIPCPAKKEYAVFKLVFSTKLWKINPK